VFRRPVHNGGYQAGLTRQLVDLYVDGGRRQAIPADHADDIGSRDRRPSPVGRARNGRAADRQPGRCVDANRAVSGRALRLDDDQAVPVSRIWRSKTQVRDSHYRPLLAGKAPPFADEDACGNCFLKVGEGLGFGGITRGVQKARE
jgi:hypothetical protein